MCLYKKVGYFDPDMDIYCFLEINLVSFSASHDVRELIKFAMKSLISKNKLFIEEGNCGLCTDLWAIKTISSSYRNITRLSTLK